MKETLSSAETLAAAEQAALTKTKLGTRKTLVLAALAGLCAASGAACVFALTPGWRVWALPVFFLLALAGAACGLLLYAAGSALQILCDIRRAVLGRDGTARAR